MDKTETYPHKTQKYTNPIYTLSHSHTIETTTTSDNHPKKGGCQRSATGCRYSVTVALRGNISILSWQDIVLSKKKRVNMFTL